MQGASLALVACVAASVIEARGAGREADFQGLVERFFAEAIFRFNPSDATSAGFHEYDGRLEDLSAAAIRAETAALKQFLTLFERFDADGLSLASRLDRDLVISKIRARLLELEVVRGWERNPDRYSSLLSSSAFTIISRHFAPPEARLKSLIGRERQMPAVLAAGRANLKDPPRIFTEIALEQLPGTISFFEKDVPSAFRGVKDRALLAEFGQTNLAVIRALGAYQKYLRQTLLARSGGDFRLGAETYRKKLLYEEMVSTPLDRLLEIGYQDLRRNQDAFRAAAARIDPKQSARQILASLEKDHPAPDKLLEAFRGVLGGLREFITRHGIVTIPSPVAPILEETPPFLRALTTASMDTPGPYEATAREAYFNVTLPEAGWPAQQVAGYMEGFNRGTILSTAIHEAYPGHYVQFLWAQRAPSKVRKLLGAGSNEEGWAHYCEQMMLDEGYGGGDPKLRLGQLQDALLRDARYVAGIRMHTGTMTLEQAIDFFVKEGYQTRAIAEREAKRGTSDPTYLVYTLGKLEILKLREEYARRKGAAYSLRDFHDRFLQQGRPPLRIVREALLAACSTPTPPPF